MSEKKYTLYGVEGSYYAAKVRSYLIQKRIPFEEVVADREAFSKVIIPRVGYPIVPVVITPDGTALQDTALIIAALENDFTREPIVPDTAEAFFVSQLLELYADEWLKIPALHYRWYYDAGFAANMMGENNDPTAAPDEQRRVGKKIAQNFSCWPRRLGVTEQTRHAVESLFLLYLHLLDRHFSEHRYLLGDRATLGDCALMGPLYAHGYRDPHSGAIMRDQAPRVCEWIERMRQVPAPSSHHAIEEKIAPTLIELLQVITRDYSPMIIAAIGTAHHYLRTNRAITAGEPLPRYLGEHVFTVGRGADFVASGTRSVHTVEIWKFQRLLSSYRNLSVAQRNSISRLVLSLGLQEMINTELPLTIKHQEYRFYLDA
ncbi:MAG: glutathione S-transferase family protein [Gammaproteobacteria bacterium]